MKLNIITKLLKITLLLSIVSVIISVNAASKPARMAATYSHNESQNINEVLHFDRVQDVSNHLTIFNVYGSIDVVGYKGDEISVNATKYVYANSQSLLDEGLLEIGLKVERQGQNIYLYLDSPYTYFDRDEGLIWHSDTCWRHDDCSRKHQPRKAYKYHMDIMVKIP